MLHDLIAAEIRLVQRPLEMHWSPQWRGWSVLQPTLHIFESITATQLRDRRKGIVAFTFNIKVAEHGGYLL